ncbi:MAG: hypothetical protein WBE13_07200, partial [Candidatus Acidiferrum sp.]
TSYGPTRGATILSDGESESQRLTARRNPRPDNEDMHILTSDEALTHLANNLQCSRMDASRMLGGLKAYAKGFYDSRTLDDAVKEHKRGKKFVADELEKQQHGPDKEVFHLLDRNEAAAATCKETGCSHAEALDALAGKQNGIPGLAKYGNFYKDVDLADWLKRHSLKISIPDKPFTPAVRHA